MSPGGPNITANPREFFLFFIFKLDPAKNHKSLQEQN